jgi:uncharacterized protein (TIRG00374 family)
VKRRYAIAGFVVILLVFGWFLRGVEWSQVRRAFAQVRLEWVGVIAAIAALRMVLFAWRWTYLLRPVHPLGFGLCFRASGVGFLSNVLLPARADLVVRAVVAGKGGRVPASSVFATVVAERLITALLFLPLAVLAMGWVKPPLLSPAMEASLRVGVGLFGAGVVAVGVALVALVRARQGTLALLGRALAFLPVPWVERIKEWLDTFVVGLRGLYTGRSLAPFITISLAIWGCWFISNLCLFQAFDLALPPSAALMLMLLQFLSFSLPTGPGFLGTYHIAATTSGLLLYGLPSAIALSAAIVLRVAVTTIIVLVGLGCLLAGRHQKLTALT